MEWLYLRVGRATGLLTGTSDKKLRPVVGGGIIFLPALLWGWSSLPISTTATVTALSILLLGGISFADDLRPIGVAPRLVIQLVAIVAPLITCALSQAPHSLLSGASALLTIPLITIYIAGFANAYNFMDGINGITALYSLVVLGTLPLIGVPLPLVWPLIAATAVFTFCNLRRNALCYAGDIGAILMGAAIASMILLTPCPLSALVIVSLYLTDAALTICSRLLCRQNIFRRHRRHIYQLLHYRLGVPSVPVAAAYAIVQAIINMIYIWMLCAYPSAAAWMSAATFIILIIIWIYLYRRLIILPESPSHKL